MLKFILLVLSVFISLVAAAHTVSFLSHGQYLEAIITFFYLFCGTFLSCRIDTILKRLLILRRRAVILRQSNSTNQRLPYALTTAQERATTKNESTSLNYTEHSDYYELVSFIEECDERLVEHANYL